MFMHMGLHAQQARGNISSDISLREDPGELFVEHVALAARVLRSCHLERRADRPNM